MKKTHLIILPLLLLPLFLVNPAPVIAEDSPNVNVTRRRPDRPTNYSPTPVSTTQPADVKQVQTKKTSWLTQLWEKFKAIFQKS